MEGKLGEFEMSVEYVNLLYLLQRVIGVYVVFIVLVLGEATRGQKRDNAWTSHTPILRLPW